MLDFRLPFPDSNRGGVIFNDQTRCRSVDIAILFNERAVISEHQFEDEDSVMSWIKHVWTPNLVPPLLINLYLGYNRPR